MTSPVRERLGGVFLGFERLPDWGVHALLLGITALISWAVYASGDAGSPYQVFFFCVAFYAAFFLGARGAALHTTAMLAGLGTALVALGDKATTPALRWALTASALVLLAVAIQALTARLVRLVERLTEIGRTDSVTGLYNAAAFAEILDNEMERARRSGNRLGVVIAELDEFATGGSGAAAAQQQLLASVGSIFRVTPRKIDMCARLGAARFGILLPYTDEHGAFLLCERIRQRIAPLGHAGMSFGVTCFPRSGANARQVVHAAEIALDEAREAGGDRVIVFQRSTFGANVEIELPEIPERQLG